MAISRRLLLAGLLLAAATPLAAQSSPSPSAARQIDGADRLFHHFIQDAAVFPGGWLEGRVLYQDHENGNRSGLGAVLGFNVAQDFEFGFSVAGLRVDPKGQGLSSDHGISDVLVWGKGKIVDTSYTFTVGGSLTLPTGDEGKGLGTGEVDAEGFAAVRKSWDVVTLSATGGMRLNQDPDRPVSNGGFPDPAATEPGEGKVSFLTGVGLLFPLAERWTLIMEFSAESARYARQDSDVRLTGGLAWRQGKFSVRGSATAGLTDGAPDFGLQVGAVLLF